MQSLKERQITDYINAGLESTPPNQPAYKAKLKLEGEYKDHEVYKIPIDFLRFRLENGRFLAEKLKFERETGISLDPDNPQHEKHFIKLLLPKLDTDSKKLIKDIEKNGQLSPGVITFDGFVVNGNRRLAVLKNLFKKTHLENFNKIFIHRLPKNIDPKEIYKIELDLQFKSSLRKDYDPINEALKIKEGVDKGLTNDEVIEESGWGKKKIEDTLRRIRYMDIFLNKIGKPGEYSLLLGYNEHFVELLKGLNKLKSKGIVGIQTQEFIDIFVAVMRVNIEGSSPSKLTHRRHLRNLPDAYLEESISQDLKNLVSPSRTVTSEEIYNTINNASNAIAFIKANKEPYELLRQADVFLKKIDIQNASIFDSNFINKLASVERVIGEIRNKITSG